MDIICVNSQFPADFLEYYKQEGVVTPVEGSLYSIRGVIRNYGKVDSLDNVGFLLEELVNPKIDNYHPTLGTIKIEPNWSIKRFTNLDGSEITMEQVRAEISFVNANNILSNRKINQK